MRLNIFCMQLKAETEYGGFCGVVGQLKRRTKSRQLKEIDASRIKEMKNFYTAAKQSKIYD